MSSFNPLTSIWNQNKLEGPNYVDWKRNLDIVLTAEGYKFIITEECPEKPDEDATDDQVKAYDKWVKADEMARCYIFASMENALQYQHQSMGSAYDVFESLKEMFGEQNRTAKQTAIKTLLNTKMAEGSSVRDRVLKMMGLLNELEVLGVLIDKEYQVGMVLQTPPDSFQQFRLNYNMNKMDLLLAKLLNELQVAKSIIKQQAPVVALNVEKASVSKSKGKSYDRIPEEPNIEPLNYDEALQDTNVDKWVIAMKSEIESMYSNQVWNLVEPPTGVKLIGCRWIYKEKK
ncbi:uncharacterized protein LOC142173606 [Nicotiana tabacum]|uniref:Uncharacterized protein LOC142173606 n=1 Tax=Nicotiana tabacum TaxID=4097 RepID=A0AC58TDM0_TOBAC